MPSEVLPELARPLLVVTGAAGYVAGLILPAMRETFRLLRIDVVDHAGEGDDEVVRADAADVGLMTELIRGSDGVLHLAAKGFEDDFLSVLLPRNVIGTWSVFEACRRAGVRKVIFASTGQTVGGNPRGTFIRPDMPPRPISVYAATKLFGEALGQYHADHDGLHVACLRLGWVVPRDSPLFATEADLPGAWCSPTDLSRLIVAAFRAEVAFAVVHVFSGLARAGFDTSNPYGWEPTDMPDQVAQ